MLGKDAQKLDLDLLRRCMIPQFVHVRPNKPVQQACTSGVLVCIGPVATWSVRHWAARLGVMVPLPCLPCVASHGNEAVVRQAQYEAPMHAHEPGTRLQRFTRWCECGAGSMIIVCLTAV